MMMVASRQLAELLQIPCGEQMGGAMPGGGVGGRGSSLGPDESIE